MNASRASRWPPAIANLEPHSCSEEDLRARPMPWPRPSPAAGTTERPSNTAKIGTVPVYNPHPPAASAAAAAAAVRAHSQFPVAYRHGRSVSHPSSSIHGADSRQEKMSAQAGLGAFRPAGEGKPTSHDRSDRIGRSSSPRRSVRASQMVVSKELITGRCKTCNYLVKWPKNLKTYRCAFCSMVNDLEPTFEPVSSSGPTPPVPTQVAAVSLDKTRAIIDRCLSSYLEFRLKHQEGNSSHNNKPLKSEPIPRPASFNRAGFNETQPVSRHSIDSRPLTSSASMMTKETFKSNEGGHAVSDFNFELQSLFPAEGNSFSSSPSQIQGLFPPQQALRRGSEGSPIMPIASTTDLSDIPPPPTRPAPTLDDVSRSPRSEPRTGIFRPLETYIQNAFSSCDCLNISFTTRRSNPSKPPVEEPLLPEAASPKLGPIEFDDDGPLSELDPRLLLLGDVAENGAWWLGKRPDFPVSRPRNSSRQEVPEVPVHSEMVSMKTPRINWPELSEWYLAVIHAGDSWRSKWNAMKTVDAQHGVDRELLAKHESIDVRDIERDIIESQNHLHKALFKATESLLKRPRRPLQQPEHIRFLLILLLNPFLYPSYPSRHSSPSPVRKTRTDYARGPEPSRLSRLTINDRANSLPNHRLHNDASNLPSQHTGIIKRIVGLLSTLSDDCQQYLISWFSRLSRSHYQRIVDLLGKFLSYRLTRQHGRKPSGDFTDLADDLIPSLGATSAQVHDAIGPSSQARKEKNKEPELIKYGEDWQITAAARVLSLLFMANNVASFRKRDLRINDPRYPRDHRGQLVHISAFYNPLLDYADLVADFETWECRPSKFSFCKYPFLLSIWAKIRIMEHDARRQMEVKSREAFFDSIVSRKPASEYLLVKVRRECLVEDSLRSVSEAVGASQEEIKKQLRIEFTGEEGVDAGGLRKEWFLLLVRDIFDPNHGLFIYDDDSKYCYFNPNCFETSDQFFLVGVVLGLAIYNSTILDVALPPFAFRKLLASAPTKKGAPTSLSKPKAGYSLDDLEELHPALARGLRQLLEFDGDVEATFCRDFVAEIDNYGQVVNVPLCPNGMERPVTNANRREFVDLYVQYLLETAVTRQYEPFKRGFYEVCGGNALSLFRPEEIELLVRGSDEALDVGSLKGVAVYDNWEDELPETIPVVRWFWDFFAQAKPSDQRKILTFITGSDRIPAMGVTFLVIKIMCIGDDVDRFPTARTCFNAIGLYRYQSREQLESKLWRAVTESEGFGLK